MTAKTIMHFGYSVQVCSKYTNMRYFTMYNIWNICYNVLKKICSVSEPIHGCYSSLSYKINNPFCFILLDVNMNINNLVFSK